MAAFVNKNMERICKKGAILKVIPVLIIFAVKINEEHGTEGMECRHDFPHEDSAKYEKKDGLISVFSINAG
jgi:hypothetical protein